MKVTSILFLVIGILFIMYGLKVSDSKDVVVLYQIKKRLTNRDITDIRAYNIAYGRLYIINGIVLTAFGVMFIYVNDMIVLSKVSLLLPLLALELIIANWFVCYKYSVKRKPRKIINWR